MPMPRQALLQDFPVEGVQRREERGRAVADVVV